MKRLLLLVVLLGVLSIGCSENEELNLPQNPTETPGDNATTDDTPIFTIGNDGAIIVNAEGGEVEIAVTTNVDYTIAIPEQAQSWLSVEYSRADVREETITVVVAENLTFEERSADIELLNAEGKVLSTVILRQECYSKVFETDAEEIYTVVAEGGEVKIAVTTNLEYSVAIPKDVQSWLSVADTRAILREETLTFTVAVNETYDERFADVELVDGAGEYLQTISIKQEAAILDMTCPSNEIWYTNGSTTDPTEPYNTDAFGVNIISNTYDVYRGCWVIKFDGDVTKIGWVAFTEGAELIPRATLKSMTIPNSVTTIEDYAFNGCRDLVSITVSDNVTEFGNMIFGDCDSLSEFKGKLASEDGKTLIVNGSIVAFAPAGLTEYTIQDGVTAIGDNVFSYCDSLTSITIPNSVTSIGEYAFYYCRKLENLIIGEGVATIGKLAFAYTGVTNLILPNSLTTIKEAAFAHCNKFTTLVIPDSITAIERQAFVTCTGLTNVTIGNGVTVIGPEVFKYCRNLVCVTIGDGVTEIFDQVFTSCENLVEFKGKFASEDGKALIVNGSIVAFAPAGLTEYTIPDGVTSIAIGAFCNCENIANVDIPNSVTWIGSYAFANCSSLTSITIPAGVKCLGPSQGGSVFLNCTALISVYCKAITPPYALLYNFDNNAPDRKIYVPTESVEVYKSTGYWSDYADDIVGYDYEKQEVNDQI